MYTIIGGDGKEYGPASADQIRTWIAAGRADENTQAKLAGSSEWRRLGDIPEFRGPSPPPLHSGAPASDPEAAAAAAVARAAKLDISSCYERSWNLLRANFWPLVGVATLIMLMEGGLSTIPGAKYGFVLLGGVFKGGLYCYFLKTARGQPVRLVDAFAGFSMAFVPLLAAQVIAGSLTIIGFFLLLLPGIYLAVAYSFTYLLIIDRGMHFWTAMEVSRRVVTAQWWRVLGLFLIGVLFCLLGLALLFVGFFVAWALIVGAVVYAYEDMFGTNSPASSAAP